MFYRDKIIFVSNIILYLFRLEWILSQVPLCVIKTPTTKKSIKIMGSTFKTKQFKNKAAQK